MKRRSKRSKYGNKRTRGFASKKEARRDQELMLLEKAGEITDLKRQVRFPIYLDGVKICTYIADHTYIEGTRHVHISCYTWIEVIEDTKGFQTAIFKLKWKMLKAYYKDRYEYRIT